jgi:branched-chain amino acid transport system ATP-binding protein
MTGNAIDVIDLVKAFGGLRAVDGVSLTVPRGQRRILIGPNGAGKTTLFHCITGTLRASSGQIQLFGHDVTALDEAGRTERGMGRTFQISNVFTDLSVEENLALAILGKSPDKWVMYRPVNSYADIRRRALEGLELVGLGHRADELVKLLSYGERRQLELALALQTRPEVLFLDEPCAGLSPSERQLLSRIISDLPRNITLMMIEHDMDVALALADHVTVLHRGRIILEGSPADVQANPEVREVYFGNV